MVGWRRFRASGVAAAGAELPLRGGGHILGNPESRKNYIAVVAPVAAAKGHAPAIQHLLESRAGARNVNLRAIAFRTASARGLPFGRRLGSGTAEAVASQGNHRCRGTGGWRRFFHGHGFGRQHRKAVPREPPQVRRQQAVQQPVQRPLLRVVWKAAERPPGRVPAPAHSARLLHTAAAVLQAAGFRWPAAASTAVHPWNPGN